MKNILVLPGTLWQAALIDKIREMGHRALVVNPAPTICFARADAYLQSDIFDIGKVIAFANENRVDAVLSDECDIAMNLVARLGELFNVPALDSGTARLYTDKFLMREFSKKLGLKYPEYKLCKTAEDAIQLLGSLQSPIIIKPLDSNASHGVFKITTEEELRERFDETMSFSRREKRVIAERFVDGVEFTVDGIKTPSAHYTLAISQKKHFAHNECIASELYFSHHNDQFDYNKLMRVNEAFVMHSNLRFGLTHAEYKCENGEFFLMEIAARGGGNMMSSVIAPYMSGRDTYRYLIECALGSIREEDFSLRAECQDRAALLKFFSVPLQGGTVKEIRGLDYLEAEPDIVQYKLNFSAGDLILPAANDSARIGFYIACCQNREKLDEVMGNVDREFEIII